jgi:predicted 2-oxoglutarate/Fe(II)-dependent dioxygenase YbiX
MNDKKTFQWYLENKKTETWCYVEDAFSSEEVDKIIEAGEKEDITEALIVTESNTLNKSYRNTSISWIPSSDEENGWIFRRLTDIVTNINNTFFNYDITTIQSLQYSIYQEGGFYKDHVDLLHLSAMGIRKLSFSIMLTDPEEYEGGELLLKTTSTPIKTPNKKGTIVFFPSYVLHEVTPVIKGTRKTLVGWVLGPNFK